jgi:hypothetical protein
MTTSFSNEINRLTAEFTTIERLAVLKLFTGKNQHQAFFRMVRV